MSVTSPGLVGLGRGAVVTVPVVTSFNSGGMSQSVRTEVPVSMAAAGEGAEPAEDTGSWQPSAASALASLVKEEMSVLSKPASARPQSVPRHERTLAGQFDSRSSVRA
jgi:hypothetical protein